MEMSGQFHAPTALSQYPLNSRLGGPQNRSESYAEESNLSRSWNPTPVAHPIACHYTDLAIRALSFEVICDAINQRESEFIQTRKR
jgi:hypothetical protein